MKLVRLRFRGLAFLAAAAACIAVPGILAALAGLAHADGTHVSRWAELVRKQAGRHRRADRIEAAGKQHRLWPLGVCRHLVSRF